MSENSESFCLDDVLSLMQTQVADVQQALRDADVDAVQQQSQKFSQLAQELAMALRQSMPYRVVDAQAVAEQVSALAQDVAMVREHLLRQQAYAEQAVQLFFPALKNQHTYNMAAKSQQPVNVQTL
ncbi:hypothetical protein KIK84_04340 [Curvibacter sp. CHRR-16]|uniref:hypothetical protein n=1 Tax=Curvibacter sp. CHRR-16 TaxID=2835872 RepID=UPI001BDA49C8|nr:hypothetical protein [Curvibacter sp. CHRR-16]MBT0569543.1 hypothetical protein [Curvibacter sp. CHRR-16]